MKKNSTITNYQIKIDLRSNLTRLMRRFAETDEIFAKRFAANLNKYFDYYINGEITKLIEYFDFYIDCQINEKITKSKVADIDYQDLHFAETAIIKKIIIMYEVDTN